MILYSLMHLFLKGESKSINQLKKPNTRDKKAHFPIIIYEIYFSVYHFTTRLKYLHLILYQELFYYQGAIFISLWRQKSLGLQDKFHIMTIGWFM